MTTSAVPAVARKISPLALPLLGVLSAVQGAAPNVASTALVGASRGLQMVAGTQAIAASMQTLAIAASVITTGLIADAIGRRKLLIITLAVGIAGNLIVAAAPSAMFYIIGQAITGVGLGAVFAASFAFIQLVAKPGRIAAAMGTYAAVAGIATIAFTFVGGTLASIDWRLAFLVIPVAALLSLIAVFAVIPPVAGVRGEKRDALGQVLLAAGLVLFLLGSSHLATSLTSLNTWGPLLGGIVLLVLCVWSQTRSAHPFFPVELLRKPIFIAALCAGFVYNFGSAVAFLQLTNLWQYVLGMKTSEVALWQLPLAASSIIAALLFGRLMSRGLNSGTMVLIGAVLSALGFAAAALAHDAKNPVLFLPAGILIGAGVVGASLPYGTLIMSQAPKEYFGPVTSSRTTFGQLFYSVGLALSTVLVDQLTQNGVVHRLLAAGVQADQIGTGIDAVTAYASAGTRPETSLGQQALAAAAESYTSAFAVTMLACALLSMLVGVLGYVLIKRNSAALVAAS